MTHEHYMGRCLDLALLAGADVGGNPNVGAVLVHNDRIIGEGYYKAYGEPHAEVNAIANVQEVDKDLIPYSTLYVSLEPCNFHGKTPPCSDLILRNKIKKLVVGCEDPNPKIAGKSLQFLSSNGVKITSNICKERAEEVIDPFRVNILLNRPFISIKFAQSSDFYISKKGEQTWLSNEHSKVFSHKLRSLNHGILIGNKTANIDDPSLTNRLYSGPNPLRICIDRENKIKVDSKLLQDEFDTLLINEQKRKEKLNSNKVQWTMPIELSSILERLTKEKNIYRLIIEGGAKTIKHFLCEDLWDQAYVINCKKILQDGIKAPVVNGRLKEKFRLGSDSVLWIKR